MKRLLVIAMLVAACGGTPASPTPLGSVSVDCAEGTKALTDALNELASRLTIGMTYAEYGDRLATAKVEYDKLKPAALTQDCLARVGKPEEDAMNEYLTAHDEWKTCLGAGGCGDYSKSQLQAHWSTATALLAGVKTYLP